MTVTVIWLIAFALILFLCLKRWEVSVDKTLDALLPAVLRSEDDRWVWSPAIAVLVATAIVQPVDLVLTLILIGLIAFVGGKLVGWALRKAH